MRRIDRTTLTTLTARATELTTRITRAVGAVHRAGRAVTSRRAAVTVVAALALAGTVRMLYASAEPPGALQGAPVAATSPTPTTTPTQTPAPTETPAQDPEGSPAPARKPTPTPAPRAEQPKAPEGPAGKPVKATPEQAAVAFYAAELGVPAERVRPLMQTRVNDHTVRVLVMAERDGNELPTRLVQVNRTQTGWRVP